MVNGVVDEGVFLARHFSENCAIRLADGRIAFGLESSILLLTPTPSSSSPSRTPRKATITDLTINGISIYGQEYEGILSKALNHTQKISLPSDKNALLTLNLGRTTVYNRTKSIIGVSPNTYIQNERLRIAAELLLEGEYTVSEVSDKAGFSDATYFYKCFKNKYGVAPSKYGKS